MFGKTTLILGAAAGYVLGARSGRERYDQIVEQANKLWGNPKVQDTVSSAQDLAKKQASTVKDKVSSSAETTSSTASGSAASVPSQATPATPATPVTPASTSPAGKATNGQPGAPKPGSPV